MHQRALYLGENYTHIRVVYAMMAINVVQTVLLGLILLN